MSSYTGESEEDAECVYIRTDGAVDRLFLESPDRPFYLERDRANSGLGRMVITYVPRGQFLEVINESRDRIRIQIAMRDDASFLASGYRHSSGILALDNDERTTLAMSPGAGPRESPVNIRYIRLFAALHFTASEHTHPTGATYTTRGGEALMSPTTPRASITGVPTELSTGCSSDRRIVRSTLKGTAKISIWPGWWSRSNRAAYRGASRRDRHPRRIEAVGVAPCRDQRGRRLQNGVGCRGGRCCSGRARRYRYGPPHQRGVHA